MGQRTRARPLRVTSSSPWMGTWLRAGRGRRFVGGVAKEGQMDDDAVYLLFQKQKI